MAKPDIDVLWSLVKPMLLPYEGGASQIFVLDLPLGSFDGALKQIHQRTTRAVITTLDGNSCSKEDASALDPVTRAQILQGIKNKTQNIISTVFHANLPVDFWIQANEDGKTFDVELVFWADQFFPDESDDTANKKAFAVLLALAEKLREAHPNCECALNGSEVSDPRNDRDKPWTVFW